MANQNLELGQKTPSYPHGYGFCQCGCGQPTKPSRSGVYPMYVKQQDDTAKISDGPKISANDDKLVELEGKYQDTVLNLRNITNDIELVTQFVKDYWKGRDDEKRLALDELTRIVKNLQKIRSSQSPPSKPLAGADQPSHRRNSRVATSRNDSPL